MTQLFIFLFLLLLSFCDWAFFTLWAVQGRWGTPFSCTSRRGQGMTDNIRERKVKKTACTPKLLPSNPKKSPVGELISLPLLHWLLVQCSLSITCSQLVVEEKEKNITKETSLMAETRKYATQIKGSNFSDTLQNLLKQPCCQTSPSPLKWRSCWGSITNHFICPEEMKVTPAWNKEWHEAK